MKSVWPERNKFAPSPMPLSRLSRRSLSRQQPPPTRRKRLRTSANSSKPHDSHKHNHILRSAEAQLPTQSQLHTSAATRPPHSTHTPLATPHPNNHTDQHYSNLINYYAILLLAAFTIAAIQLATSHAKNAVNEKQTSADPADMKTRPNQNNRRITEYPRISKEITPRTSKMNPRASIPPTSKFGSDDSKATNPKPKHCSPNPDRRTPPTARMSNTSSPATALRHNTLSGTRRSLEDTDLLQQRPSSPPVEELRVGENYTTVSRVKRLRRDHHDDTAMVDEQDETDTTSSQILSTKTSNEGSNNHDTPARREKDATRPTIPQSQINIHGRNDMHPINEQLIQDVLAREQKTIADKARRLVLVHRSNTGDAAIEAL